MRNEPSRKEQLMQQLVQKSKALQCQVTSDDMRNDPTMAPPNDYAFYWGSFDEVAEIAWLEARQQLQDTDSLSDESSVQVKAKRSSVETVVKTKQEWLEWMLGKNNGALPTFRMLKMYHPVEMRAILDEFGDWRAVEAMYVTLKKSNKLRGPKEPARAMKPKASKPVVKPKPEPRPRPAPKVKSKPAPRSGSKSKSELTPPPPPPPPRQVNVVEKATRVRRDASVARTVPSQTEVKPCAKLRQTAVPLSFFNERLAEILGTGSIKLSDVKMTVVRKDGKPALKIQRI